MSSICLTPKETTDTLVQSSIKKASFPIVKRMLLSIMAGAYISLGAQGFLAAYGNSFIRASVFPVGLMMIVLVGGELFTGNCLMTFGLIKKEITLKDYISTLIQVIVGNFLGALFIAVLLYMGGMYKKPELAEAAITVAKSKASIPFVQVLCRGILCNVLVTLAVWFASTSKDTMGKLFGCWFPVMLFVLCGYEHVVANMFFLPVGMMLDSSVSMAGAASNLVASAIGNYIGGGILIPFIYNHIYYN